MTASDANDLTKDILLLHKEAFGLKKKQGVELVGSVNQLVPLFNSCLTKAKALFFDNPMISTLTEMQPTPIAFNMIAFGQAHGKAEELYIQTARLMNALKIDIKEPNDKPASLVQLTITQQVSQFMNFSYEQLIQTIQQQSVEEKIRQDAIQAVKLFDEEIGRPKPDQSKLKSCLDKVALVGRNLSSLSC